LRVAIAAYTKNEISDSKPILSATLPDGERVQVVMPPACERGAIFDHDTQALALDHPDRDIPATGVFLECKASAGGDDRRRTKPSGDAFEWAVPEVSDKRGPSEEKPRDRR